MIQLDLPSDVRALLEDLDRAGARPLLVGGLVRDALLGNARPEDWDVEVYGLDLDEVVDLLRRHGKVHQVGRSFGVLKTVTPGGETLDVSLPRTESKRGRGHRGFLVTPDPGLRPEDAARRRDYTINAMLWDPIRETLIDPFDGRGDLARGVLRHVGDAFAEDPLRVLRGVHFAGRFDLQGDPRTLELCRSLLDEYDTLAIERIWMEWWKWAARSTRPSRGLEFLRGSGWLALYPELEALVGCPQDPEWHPEGDVWRHTGLVADAAAEIAARDDLADGDRAVLVFAALAHDLGKPETTFDDAGRIRSPGHAERDETIGAFLDRIGMPASPSRRVQVLSRFHLTHLGFTGSKRHVRRLARALGEGGETIPMLARLVEADGSGRPPLPGGLPDSMRALCDVAREVHAEDAAPRPVLLGRHLIDEGWEPGPAMGEILRRAYEAQLDGAFDDLDGALAWLRAQTHDA